MTSPPRIVPAQRWDFVTDKLALGGRIPAGDEHLLARDAISRVVDLRAECADDPAVLASHGVAWLHLPTPDLMPMPLDRIDLGVAWVRAWLQRGHRILIHCEHGIGRSALLTACVLVAEGRSPGSALRLTKSARPRVSPTPEQLHALLDWARTRHGHAADTWDALAAIAYEHLR